MATERTVLVRLKANASDFNRAMVEARASLKGLRNEIDTTNDRTAWLAQSILGLGPALLPIGAVAVPAIAALATQLTVAGVAVGTLGLAFHGVGDGLKALNDYQLAPTAENLEKMRVAMAKLGPDGAHFVRFLDDAGSQLTDLQMVARGGVFPGMEEGITHLLTLMPQAKSIIGEVASGLGELSAEAGKGLAGGRFEAFFDYIQSDARPILMDMGHTVGFLTEGLANLLVGFGPMSMDFSNGMEGMARSFAEWSRTLDQNQSFQDFLDYIQQSEPRVRDFFGALSEAFVGILRAGAPVGEVLLPALTKFLDVIADLANTPLGPTFLAAAAAMSVYGRVAALTSVTTGGLGDRMLRLNTVGQGADRSNVFSRQIPSMREWGNAAMHSMHSQDQLNTYFGSGAEKALKSRDAVKAYGRQISGTAAQVGLMALAASGLSDKMGLSNTVMMAMVGNMVGPYGAAIGATVGAVMDLASANSQLADATKAAHRAQEEGDIAGLNSALAAQQAAAKQKFGRDIQGGAATFQLNPLQNFNTILGITTGKLGDVQDEIGKTQGALLGMAMWNAGKQFLPINQVDLLNQGLRTTGAGAKYASMSIEQFTAHVQQLNNVLEGRASLRDYEQALDDFTAGLKKNGHSMDINTQKGRDNQAALDNIAATAIRVTKNMSQTQKIRVLSAARADFIDAAKKAHMSEAAASKLADRVLGLNAIKGQPKVDVKGADKGQSQISALRQALRNLDGANANTYITVHRRGASVHAPNIVADGGQMIARTNLGETTGRRDDTIPALLSHREWVHNVDAVDYYGDRFMADVNARRFPRPQGYADGGSVGIGSRVSVAAPNVTTGDTYLRVSIDGQALDARIEQRMDERGDVDGSYVRAARTAE